MSLEGDPIYALIQDATLEELNTRKRENNAYLQTLLPYATGNNLDNLVSLTGLTRQTKEEATFDDDGIELTPEVLETDALPPVASIPCLAFIKPRLLRSLQDARAQQHH